MKKQHLVIGTAITVVLAFGGGAYFYKSWQAAQVSALAGGAESPLNRLGSPTLGEANAKVQIVEFFDPACEACRMMYPYVKSLLRTHRGKLQLSIRYAAFHPGSDYVVKALEAARLQGNEIYLKTLDAVMANQPAWANHEKPDVQSIWNYLGDTGLNIERAKNDMNSDRITALLKQDAKDINTLKIDKTPSFFINGKPLSTFSPGGLRSQVEDEIKLNYSELQLKQ